MASDFCNIPNDEVKQIKNLLPPLPGIQRLVDIIMQKINEIKNKYSAKIGIHSPV